MLTYRLVVLKWGRLISRQKKGVGTLEQLPKKYVHLSELRKQMLRGRDGPSDVNTTGDELRDNNVVYQNRQILTFSILQQLDALLMTLLKWMTRTNGKYTIYSTPTIVSSYHFTVHTI